MQSPRSAHPRPEKRRAKVDEQDFADRVASEIAAVMAEDRHGGGYFNAHELAVIAAVIRRHAVEKPTTIADLHAAYPSLKPGKP